MTKITIAENIKQLADEYAHCYAFVNDETMPIKHRELHAAIDVLVAERDAALARKFPPEGWVAIPLEPSEDQLMFAQGALMDMQWSAIECFIARVQTLISLTRDAYAEAMKVPL